ncbi:MAG: phosphatase PAP2 family protein [Comamonas sp.]
MPSSTHSAPTAQAPGRRWLAATLAGFALVLLWDQSGLDLAVARLWGGAQGFALRDNPFLDLYMHDAMQWLGWALAFALSIGVWFPFGVLRRLPVARRVQVVVSVLAALALVGLLKHSSSTSCPWDMAAFGGLAEPVSHWRWGLRDGGSGHCFPAGHAATGFAFVGGYFALHRDAPRAARWWLLAALAVGAVLGLAQQMRGAHYTSHTLWTAWLCWLAGWLTDTLVQRLQRAAGR